MTQLVLIGNRVAAHGVDCFLSMGGTVICPDSGKAYQNATIAEHDDNIPSDIDSVGYEYIAGEFRPCAPYGKTETGNFMAACDSCSQPKSTDVELKDGNIRLNSKGVVLSEKSYGTDLPDDGDFSPGRIFLVKGCIPILKMVYPVGSVYMSIASTNPADVFGFGTWEAMTDDTCYKWKRTE